MIKVSDLVDNKYQRYKVDPATGAACLWQKWIKAEDGKKLYAIDVYEYHFPDGVPSPQFQVGARFYIGGGSDFIDVQPYLDETGLQAYEALLAGLYDMLEATPDPHN